MNRRGKILLGANRLNYPSTIYGWLLILSSDKESIITNHCGQNIHFPVGFTNSCLKENIGLAQSKGLVQIKQPEFSRLNKTIPLILKSLHFKMSTFTKVYQN